MTCEQVMTRNPQCCVPTDTATRVARIMKIEDVGAVPVCGSRESRRLVGIVTDRDLTLEVVAEGRDPSSVRVQELMTREPFTCRADEDIETAMKRMQSNQVRRIPVVDNSGQLIGIISQADIAAHGETHAKTADVVKGISRPSGTRL